MTVFGMSEAWARVVMIALAALAIAWFVAAFVNHSPVAVMHAIGDGLAAVAIYAFVLPRDDAA